MLYSSCFVLLIFQEVPLGEERLKGLASLADRRWRGGHWKWEVVRRNVSFQTINHPSFWDIGIANYPGINETIHLSVCLPALHTVMLAHLYFFHTDRHKQTHTSADNHIYEDSDPTYKVMSMFIQQSQKVLPGFNHTYTRHTLSHKCVLHTTTLAVEHIHSITHIDAHPQMVRDPPHTEGWVITMGVEGLALSLAPNCQSPLMQSEDRQVCGSCTLPSLPSNPPHTTHPELKPEPCHHMTPVPFS